MTIGKKISDRRKELNMSQDELAKKMGYKSRSTINKIELGINDVPQRKIVQFASALDTTIQYLMDCNEEGDVSNPKPVLTPKDKIDIAKEVEALISGLETNTALSFDGSDYIDDTTRELLKKSLESTLETARIIAKEKYTPNKYRK